VSYLATTANERSCRHHLIFRQHSLDVVSGHLSASPWTSPPHAAAEFAVDRIEAHMERRQALWRRLDELNGMRRPAAAKPVVG